jgi:hypothetical protein
VFSLKPRPLYLQGKRPKEPKEPKEPKRLGVSRADRDTKGNEWHRRKGKQNIEIKGQKRG